jgi:hypothetical protein
MRAAILGASIFLGACGGGYDGGGSGGAPLTYRVGGTVSGLTGTVVLQNNGGDNLSISANGAFTFPTPLAYGSSYDVTVLTQPMGQTCTVANRAGAYGGSSVTSVTVTCR